MSLRAEKPPPLAGVKYLRKPLKGNLPARDFSPMIPKGSTYDMPDTTPPRNLTPGLRQRIEAEMLEACAAVAARHGLTAEGLGIKSMNLRWNFEFGVRVSIPLADGTTLQPERLLFEVMAPEYGLQPQDFGREFWSGGHRFRIAGIEPRRPKYPVSATRLPDGARYKFPAEKVVTLLQFSMKDVTPKA